MTHKNLTLADLNKLAQTIAKKSSPESRIFGLVGTLGAGKTTFTQAAAKALGIKQAKSPTFTIINCYEGPKKSLYHIDLYRLEKDKELQALGLDEIMDDENNLVFIEWVDKFPNLLKKCHAIIKLEITKDNKRNAIITNN